MKNPCGCGNAVKGEWTAGQCRFCWLGLNDPRYIHLFRDQLPFSAFDCIHRGAEVGRSQCESCNGNVQVKRFACAKHGECSLEKDVGAKVCGGCPDKSPLNLHHAHDWHDLGNLIPGERNFNSSMIRWRGRLVMATRHHTRDGWSKGRISLANVRDDFQGTTDLRFIELDHPLTNHGIEDPRLFIHDDALHVAFTGVQNFGPAIATHQLYARLNDDLEVQRVFSPNYYGRQPWEKNWGFFSEGGQLYAVYMIAGHKVLKIDGDKTELVYESAAQFPPAIGEPRGGAAPVKRGNEWYSFFHDIRPGAERREYKLCFYTFEDRPPFRVNRFGRVPLFEVTKSHRPNDWTPDVVFPGGAFLENNLWHVAGGYYDQWSWLLRFDVNRIEELLDVATGGRDAAFDFRAACLTPAQSYGVWANVYNRNEYELPDSLAGQTVVDLGGHIGSFARLCLDRGAQHVLSYEPLAENCQAYRHNMAQPGADPTVGMSLPPCSDLPVYPQDEHFYDDQDGGRRRYYPWLRWLAEHFRARVIGEIGVFRGNSARAMAAKDRSYVGLDDGKLAPLPSVDGYAHAAFHQVNTRDLTTLADYFTDPVDLFHVDGDHSRRGCFADLLLAESVLAPEGVIVVDDAFPGSEPYQAALEFASRGYVVTPMSKQRTMTGKVLLQKKWRLIEAAAFGGDPPSTATMGGYSLADLGNWERVRVATVQLGRLECDLLKIDVEGAEYEILANADLSGVGRIVGEGHLYPGQPDMVWLVSQLQAKGFSVRTQVTGDATYLFWCGRF